MNADRCIPRGSTALNARQVLRDKHKLKTKDNDYQKCSY